MLAKKISARSRELLDPRAAAWAEIEGEIIKMDATPLANQPSEYIKVSRDERKIGKVRELTVKTAHNGQEIFFWLEWQDDNKDVEITDIPTFPDGCGVLMPIKVGTEPPIDEMGKKEEPVNAWFWRADFEDKPKNTWAKGLGTTEFSEKSFLFAQSQWEGGVWRVVLGRPLTVAERGEESVQLEVGKPVKVGFAVWEGSNGERAGVKSFSKEWRDLTLEA